AERVPTPQPTPAAIEALPREVPAQAQTAVAVAVAATAPPPTNAPQAEAHPTVAPQATAEPVLAARDEARPLEVSVGSVRQNTNVANVNQGTVVQSQDLALLQYVQLLALSPNAGLASPAPSPARRPRGTTNRHVTPFSMPLTNPDNPWGFDFPPTVLVK